MGMGSFYESLYLLTSVNYNTPIMTNVVSESLLPVTLTDLPTSALTKTFLSGSLDMTMLDMSLLPCPTTGKILSDDSDEFGYLDLQVANYQKKYPHLTIDEIFNQISMEGESSEISNIDTSSSVDVTKLSPKEIIFLANSVDDVNKFEALEHIRSTYVSSAPNVKLYYPEPFIASASFIHNDIGFIHILQYQF